MAESSKKLQLKLSEELKSFLTQEKFGEHIPTEVPGIGYRHIQVLLYFFGVAIGFGFRIVLSVSIVAMTDPATNNNTHIPTYPEWTDSNVIQSAFFWGYVMPQIFAGWAATKFSAKWFLTVTFAVNSVAGFLIPQAAALFGSKGVMLCRVLQGLSQGFLFPMVTSLLSHWVPNKERSMLSGIVYAAGSFGTIVAILSTGMMCASQYGWPIAYYIYGLLGIFWCILMVVFGSDSPADHPRIGKAERYYIESDIHRDTTKKKPPTPWRAFLTSKPLWALLIAQIGDNYSVWTFLTQIPTYMRYVMKYDIKNNSILSSLPYIVTWLLSFVVGYMSDFVINHHYLSMTKSRKLFNSLGLLLPTVCLIILSFITVEQKTLAVALLVVTMGFNSFHFAGYSVNAIDLSPNHSGTVVGICNGFSQITGIIAPLVVQFVVTDKADLLQWRIVFLIAAVLMGVASTIFIVWGSGKVQPWNDHPDDDEEEKQKC